MNQNLNLCLLTQLNDGHKLVDDVVTTINCLDGPPLAIDPALGDNVMANES